MHDYVNNDTNLDWNDSKLKKKKDVFSYPLHWAIYSVVLPPSYMQYGCENNRANLYDLDTCKITIYWHRPSQHLGCLYDIWRGLRSYFSCDRVSLTRSLMNKCTKCTLYSTSKISYAFTSRSRHRYVSFGIS